MEWKTAWSYLPINHNCTIGSVSNITQRAYFKNNIGGNKVKIKLSNLYSLSNLVMESVTLGKRKHDRDEVYDIIHVTKDGNEKINIPAGKEVYSDVIDLITENNVDIVVSIYVKQETEIKSVCSTWLAKSWQSVFTLDGDFTYEGRIEGVESVDVFPSLKYDDNKSTNLFGISEIKVLTENSVTTVALFGDSITHMSYYSDPLIEKLYKEYPGRITVVNRGIGGNRLLKDYSRVEGIPSGGTIFGKPGADRFYNDVYSTDQPDIVIVLIGINDFSHPYAFNHLDEEVTINEYRIGMEKLANISHENRSKIYFCTIMPFISGDIEWHKKTEELRQDANNWIQSQRIADEIIDFDEVVRKTGNPEVMQDNYHLGDGLHPNEEGGNKMVSAINISWF